MLNPNTMFYKSKMKIKVSASVSTNNRDATFKRLGVNLYDGDQSVHDSRLFEGVSYPLNYRA